MAMRKFTGTVKHPDGQTRPKRWEVHNKPPKSFAAFKELLLRPYGEGAELVTLVEKTKAGDVPIDLNAETTPAAPVEQ